MTSPSTNPPILIIYHGNCPDGFAAALAAKLHFEALGVTDLTFFSGKHGSKAPNCSGKDVYIVDFSYKEDVIYEICQQAHHVTIIDHHISAQRDLEGLEDKIENLSITFDMKHSGAVLSWQFFHKTPVPLLFKYVEDRDIWKFELEHTDDVLSAVNNYKMDFDLWSSWINDEKSLNALRHEGAILNKARNQLIEKYVKRARVGNIAGHKVPIVNAPSSIVSDLLQILSNGHEFAISYEDRESKRVWQLRSSGEKAIDVSEVARLYGGGGHKNASSFSTTVNEISI